VNTYNTYNTLERKHILKAICL